MDVNIVVLEDLQIQRKYKHIKRFGVIVNPSRDNFELFKDKIEAHMKDSSTIITEGTYKKNIQVTHYYNEKTRLNVMINKNDNAFLSGWKLTKDQLENILKQGSL